jgi:deoxyhypusine synthase
MHAQDVVQLARHRPRRRHLQHGLEDKACSPWLILAGSTSAGGCMHVYRDMVKFGMIDAVVATGASIVDMDFFEALGFKHYQAAGEVDDNVLRENYIDRIYDTYIDEEELQACDHTILEICNRLEPRGYSEPRVHLGDGQVARRGQRQEARQPDPDRL